MQNNLLLALSKYRPREGHTPLENFITESFASLLRNNTHFVVNFFKQFFDVDISPSKVKVNTQLNLEGNFPDMVITIDSSVWIFEHKTFTRLSPNQLNKYRDSANKQFDNVKIVLITGFKSQHEQEPEFKLTWCDVYNFLINFKKSNKESNGAIFFDYLSELLKENGLGPQPALSYESIINYLPTKDFRGNLQRILWAIHSRIKEGTDLGFFL